MTRNSFNLSRKSNLNEAARNLYKFFRSIKKKGYKKIYVTKFQIQELELLLMIDLKELQNNEIRS